MTNLQVLCFDCGGTFYVPQYTATPTTQCPKCKEDKNGN